MVIPEITQIWLSENAVRCRSWSPPCSAFWNQFCCKQPSGKLGQGAVAGKGLGISGQVEGGVRAGSICSSMKPENPAPGFPASICLTRRMDPGVGPKDV